MNCHLLVLCPYLLTTAEAGSSYDNVVEDAEVGRKVLEDNLAQIISQTNKEEQEYQAEQILNNQARSWSMYLPDFAEAISSFKFHFDDTLLGCISYSFASICDIGICKINIEFVGSCAGPTGAD